MKEQNEKPLEILNTYINKQVKDIYLTGYSEVKSDFNFFSAMLWWYYIEFEDSYLCIESKDSKEMLQFSIHQKIQCNFEIEDDDVFTITSISKDTYSAIISFDLFYGNDDCYLYALGILFKDNKYIFLDSLTLNGIQIGDVRDKSRYLEDARFRIEIIPS